ncbi:hypothetical protein Anapl_05820 [Anas platyrhynchos]|uniref:Uncharacterized protein n=1 Tax=Anas platyrhynchos TaxID=8839 RepID=R0LIN2_ANAPL|nr:hypothetical protein Anapl_05820 [Anas platyrhynchos]
MRPNEAKNFSIFHLYSKNKISSGNANDNRSTCLGTERTKDVTRALPNESSVWVLVTEPTPGPDAACLKRGRLAGNRHVAINRLFTLHLLPSPQLQSTRPPTHEPGTSQHRQKVKGTQTCLGESWRGEVSSPVITDTAVTSTSTRHAEGHVPEPSPSPCVSTLRFLPRASPRRCCFDTPGSYLHKTLNEWEVRQGNTDEGLFSQQSPGLIPRHIPRTHRPSRQNKGNFTQTSRKHRTRQLLSARLEHARRAFKAPRRNKKFQETSRLVTAFAEAIAPDVGSYLQMDDKHLLLGKLNARRPPILQGRCSASFSYAIVSNNCCYISFSELMLKHKFSQGKALAPPEVMFWSQVISSTDVRSSVYLQKHLLGESERLHFKPIRHVKYNCKSQNKDYITFTGALSRERYLEPNRTRPSKVQNVPVLTEGIALVPRGLLLVTGLWVRLLEAVTLLFTDTRSLKRSNMSRPQSTPFGYAFRKPYHRQVGSPSTATTSHPAPSHLRSFSNWVVTDSFSHTSNAEDPGLVNAASKCITFAKMSGTPLTEVIGDHRSNCFTLI